MNSFLVELPAELRSAISRWTHSNPNEESAWIAEAIREKLAAETGLVMIRSRAARGDREAFLRVLAKTPALPLFPGDEQTPRSDLSQ